MVDESDVRKIICLSKGPSNVNGILIDKDLGACCGVGTGG